MDSELYKQAIKDAREFYGTIGNAMARDLLLRKIAKWREQLKILERQKHERSSESDS